MSTSTFNNSSQIVLTVDDESLVKKITNVAKMIKGVSSVRVQKTERDILTCKSYKKAMKDVKEGNVTTYSSADEIFNDLLK